MVTAVLASVIYSLMYKFPKAELENSTIELTLVDCNNDALELLNVGGRCVVITFHSLEDKIIKKIFKEKCKIDDKVKGMPNIPEEYLPDFKLVVNKAIVPSEEELSNNPRARSSKLKVIERIK